MNQDTKICSKCNQEKILLDFVKDKTRKDGFSYICKKCLSIKFTIYRRLNIEKIKQYRLNNITKIKKRDHLYYINNKFTRQLYNKQYYIKNIEKHNQNSREYYEKNKNSIKKQRIKNKDRRNKQLKNRRRYDINFKIIHNNTVRIKQALKNNQKTGHTIELIGCSVDELKSHLQKQFTTGMSWENYGKGGWDIDHIIPCSFFDFTDPEQQKKCCHYSNLQPMWHIENIKKGNKIH
jgi:hypothetical protein